MHSVASSPFRLTYARYERGELTLEKLRYAFLEEIFTHGFQRTSICKVTSRANLTRGAFYNYWNSLQECLADVILLSRKNKGETDRIKEIPTNNKDSSMLLYKLKDFFFKYRKDFNYAYLPLILLHEKDFSNKEIRKLLLDSFASLRLQWETVIQRDQKFKVLCIDIDPQITASCILNFISGIIQNTVHDSKVEDLNRPLKYAFENYVRSLFSKRYRKENDFAKINFFEKEITKDPKNQKPITK